MAQIPDLPQVEYTCEEGFTDVWHKCEGNFMKWISVKDKLPTQEQTVLVLVYYVTGDDKKFSPYCLAEDISGAIFWKGEFYLDHPTKDYPCVLEGVTHWIELPKAPVD